MRRIQRFNQQRGHRRQLFIAGAPCLHAHDHQPERVVPHLRNHVHRRRRKRVQVLGKSGVSKFNPWGAGREVFGLHGRFSWQHRGHRKTAVANDFRGHPLTDLGLGTDVHRQGVVGVGVDIDQARRHDQATRIDDPLRRAIQ